MAFAIYNDISRLISPKWSSMKVKYLVALVSVFCASVSWAREPFVVRDIRVEGIQRTEAGNGIQLFSCKGGRHA